MGKVEKFTKELNRLCKEYEVGLTGGTIDKSVIVRECKNCSFHVKQKNENNAFIKCNCL